jgi:hypothetical protein
LGGINLVLLTEAFKEVLERDAAVGTKPTTAEGSTQEARKREKDSFMMDLVKKYELFLGDPLVVH